MAVVQLEGSMWKALPVSVRAVVLGLIVSGVPTVIWAMLAVTNLHLTPRLPWSAPAMAVILWLSWRYLGGDGPPRRTAAFRSEHLRAAPLTPGLRRLALLAGGAGVAAVWAAFAALRGVMHIAAPAGDVSQFPLITVIASIVMRSEEHTSELQSHHDLVC